MNWSIILHNADSILALGIITFSLLRAKAVLRRYAAQSSGSPAFQQDVA